MEVGANLRSLQPNTQQSMSKQMYGSSVISSAAELSVAATAPITQFAQTSMGTNSLKQFTPHLPIGAPPTSPLKEMSPFRFPELPHHVSGVNAAVGYTTANQQLPDYQRRDSLFERTDQIGRYLVHYFTQDDQLG